jgi:tRNA modification GTPase
MTVLDTAGIRDSDDPVEQEGVRRARLRAAQADLILWVVDAADPKPAPPPEDGTQVPEIWVLVNKCDITQGLTQGPDGWPGDYKSVAISARTGQCFDKLLAMLQDFLVSTFSTESSVVITRERHRHLLASCHEALGRALAESQGREDIIAEELRLAARALGRLTGRVDVEDILDVIFRDFCIGK